MHLFKKEGSGRLDTYGIEDITNCLSKIHKLFDIVRIIDPVEKKVIHYNDMNNGSNISNCYDFWRAGTSCCNCVSIRAMKEKDTFMKLEYKDGRVFMSMASPVQLEADEYIIEMIKDITETGFITELACINLKETRNIISQLNEKAITDELTGIYNRRYINEKLPADLYEAVHNKQTVSMMMVDIDCFKRINDTYGHKAGDTVLIELCKIMKSQIRENDDWIARYGGEEFLILLKNTNKEIAYKVSEKIRKALENQFIKYNDHMIQVTASIGTYTVEPGAKSCSEVLSIIDKNLYAAKSKGRNRTVSS